MAAIDTIAFPPPRLKRNGAGAGGLSALAAPKPTPPQSHVFGFVLRANASTRSTTSSPKLLGPSLVRGLHFSKGGAPDGTAGIVLGKALSPQTELNVAIATARPFTPLFFGTPGIGTANGAPNDAVSLVDMQPSILTDADDLGIIVLDRDWYLTITAACNAPGTDEFHGYVTVLDQVNLAALATFL